MYIFLTSAVYVNCKYIDRLQNFQNEIINFGSVTGQIHHWDHYRQVRRAWTSHQDLHRPIPGLRQSQLCSLINVNRLYLSLTGL